MCVIIAMFFSSSLVFYILTCCCLSVHRVFVVTFDVFQNKRKQMIDPINNQFACRDNVIILSIQRCAIRANNRRLFIKLKNLTTTLCFAKLAFTLHYVFTPIKIHCWWCCVIRRMVRSLWRILCVRNVITSYGDANQLIRFLVTIIYLHSQLAPILSTSNAVEWFLVRLNGAFCSSPSLDWCSDNVKMRN